MESQRNAAGPDEAMSTSAPPGAHPEEELAERRADQPDARSEGDGVVEAAGAGQPDAADTGPVTDVVAETAGADQPDIGDSEPDSDEVSHTAADHGQGAGEPGVQGVSAEGKDPASTAASGSLFVKALVIEHEEPVAYGRPRSPAAPPSPEAAAPPLPGSAVAPVREAEPGHAQRTAPVSEPAPLAPVTPAVSAEWSQIKMVFVDDPRRSVEGAARLVEDSVNHLADLISSQRASLTASSGDSYSAAETERLRIALLGYRRIFDDLRVIAERVANGPGG